MSQKQGKGLRVKGQAQGRQRDLREAKVMTARLRYAIILSAALLCVGWAMEAGAQWLPDYAANGSAGRT